MGELAKELVRLSGPDAVHGVIPTALVQFEREGKDLDQAAQKKKEKNDEKVFGRTTVVPDMHTRKQTMVREVLAGGPGSGFVALSGGYGTLEELMEVSSSRADSEETCVGKGCDADVFGRLRLGISWGSMRSR